MSLRIRALVALTVLAAAATAGGIAERRILPRDRVLPGARVEGALLSDELARADDAQIASWIDQRVETLLDREVEVRAGPAKRTVKLRELASPVDSKPIVARLRALGRSGSLATRIDEALRTRRGEIDVPIPIDADSSAVERIVASMKAEVDEPATDAKLDLAGHKIIQDHSGHLLEYDGAVVSLADEVVSRAHGPATVTAAIQLSTLELPAKTTAASLAKLDISTVVASFETFFGRGGDQAPRAGNIEVAARKLDGLVLEPGQLVSFNDVVGERSEANGFKVAWEIFKGEMRPGVGGGTCQVASTFHAAAFFGGLEILERLPHSRPSAYIPMGLDSTVVYPVVDLKMKNPHPFPVVVHTKVNGNSVVVELLGKSKPVNVVFGRDVVDILPYTRRIDEESWVAAGKAIKKQGGIRGYRVRRSRTIQYASGGQSKTEITYDFYPATTEIYLVAPGTDPNDLPPLPDDVQELMTKKKGAEPAEKEKKDSTAVACAGNCEGDAPPKPAIEVKNAAGVHDPVGDQVAPGKSVSIKQ
jgi:vancomycin resistance protein YoaR